MQLSFSLSIPNNSHCNDSFMHSRQILDYPVSYSAKIKQDIQK